MPTDFGEFDCHLYRVSTDHSHHIALSRGPIDPEKPTLVRVHSECLTGDVFGSHRCDCGAQLGRALKAIADEKKGVFLYMRQEGRGIGLLNKIRAYELQDNGLDTVEANVSLGFPPDLRHYGVGAQILSDLGVCKIRLLTNNPKKIVGLEGYDLEVTRRQSIEIKPVPENLSYLKCKKDRMGHLFDLPENTKI